MRLVTVQLHRDEDAGWWAETDALPGYTAADPDLDELRRLMREGLQEFLGEPVVLAEQIPGGLNLLAAALAPVMNVMQADVAKIGTTWGALKVVGLQTAVPA